MFGINTQNLWWTAFWPRIPFLLALSVGVVVAMVAYFRGTRRTAGCLAALGFGALILVQLLLSLVSVLFLGSTAFWAFVVYLGSIGAVGLLVAAVIWPEPKPAPPEEEYEVTSPGGTL